MGIQAFWKIGEDSDGMGLQRGGEEDWWHQSWGRRREAREFDGHVEPVATQTVDAAWTAVGWGRVSGVRAEGGEG